MTSENMTKRYVGVRPRAGSKNWQWCIRPPTDLVSLYPEEWAYRGSLGTSDLREANRLALDLHAKWLRRFDEQRRELHPQQIDRITPELAGILAKRISAAILSRDETLRAEPGVAALLVNAARAASPSSLTIGTQPPPAPFLAPADALAGLSNELAAELSKLNGQMSATAALQMATQRIGSVLAAAQAEARKLGISFDANTPGAREALRECLKAARIAWHEVTQRDRGEVVETPAAPTRKQAEQVKPTSLRDVFIRWKAVKPRSPDTNRACERALELFEQHTGDTPLQQITRAQGDGFRSWLQTLGSSSKTAHDRMTWVKSLLVYAYRDLELISRQPWEGIDIDYRTEKPRKPWTDEEIKAFFSLPLFTAKVLPTDPKAGGMAAYWVPLLGLYTGARVGELCQLRAIDIENGKSGPFIRITEEAKGATVKTAAGVRRVPVHSELVRLGFLDYVATVDQAGSLWPAMRPRKGKPGAYFSDWVNPFHKVEIRNAKAPVFHELRHTVRTALHAAGVDRETIGLLIGHETGLSEAEKAYTHVTDSKLRNAVEHLKNAGLRLQR